ncbi:hypothetical protein KVV02_006323 [Mortierella alpina]|uniref:C2H2-type domain-containing protein n=1 Tax=Mortierella alpina TaxID=64518 RepID=A0A9P8IF44_MORAP|nr:hypothetical protein KVV02_006323 [Mortierella alpina]
MTLLLSSHSPSASNATGPILSVHSRHKAEPAAGPASTLTPPADPAEVDALDALLSMSMTITNINHDVPSPRAPPAPSSPVHGIATANNNSFRISNQLHPVHDRLAHVFKSEPDSSTSHRLDSMAKEEEQAEDEQRARTDSPRASQRSSAAPFVNNTCAGIDSLLKTHQQLSTSTSTSPESQTTTRVQPHKQTHLPRSMDSAPSSPQRSSSNILHANPANSYEHRTLSDTAPSVASTIGDSLESDHYDDAEDEGEDDEDDEDGDEGDDPDHFHLHPLHALPGTKRKPQSEASKKGRSLYTCSHPGCGRSFDRRFNRDSHEMTHNPDRQRPFVCSNPECDQAFMRRHDLQRHEASKHKSVRLFSCQRCNKSFSRQDGLRRHVASKRLCFDKKSHFT